MLLGIKELLGLELSQCDIPVRVLPTLGVIINTNANNMFVLNLGYNYSIREHFHMITEQVTSQDPLVLSQLDLSGSLDSSDSKSLSEFLQKTKNMKILNLYGCECEVSHSVIKLLKLRELWIPFTVNRSTKKGMNLKTILSNLHQLQSLERLNASHCEINDSEIQTLQVEKLDKIRLIDLSGNRMSDKVKLQIKEKFEKRGIECKV